jgi:acyl-CoA reductase-like NAD-dependent aldehyde dehydrogenase
LGEVETTPAAAIAAIVDAAAVAQRQMPPPWLRAEALEKAAASLAEQSESFATTIAQEAGKPIVQARAEVARAISTLRLSAIEARTLVGEMVPMEATAAGAGRIGFVLRRPLGVVAAITPFNFPLNLTVHKVAPALAAGNAVIVKPASATPLSALALRDLLIASGFEPDLIQVVCGGGREVGGTLSEASGVAAVSFTGSVPVGRQLRAAVPLKKVLLELGSTAPLIVAADGDWEGAADRVSLHGFSHAGQSCVSVQRIIIERSVADGFVERLVERVGRLTVGDPMDEATDVGPLIDTASRDRVVEWTEAARAAGARVCIGGEVNPDGTLQPTVILDPPRNADVWCEEVFGPLVAIRVVDDFDAAIEEANDSRFGLQAGVFTRDLAQAMQAADRLAFGSVLINEVPTVRLDQQPYGGVRESGNTREGPHYVVRELTEERFVSLPPAGDQP